MISTHTEGIYEPLQSKVEAPKATILTAPTSCCLQVSHTEEV